MTLVFQEMGRAKTRFGPFTSSHEGLGVLLEEFHELRRAVEANQIDAIRKEAIQCSAVALRIAQACGLRSFVERSGAKWESADQP